MRLLSSSVCDVFSLFFSGKLKPQDLRGDKDKAELEALLEERRKSLAQLRIEQKSGGNQAKLSQIKVVRKEIARILTIINQQVSHQVRIKYSGKEAKRRPRDLRQKKTRAIRRRLKPSEASAKTQRALTKHNNFPQRKFAIKA